MPRRCTICHNPQHEEIAVSLFRDGTRDTARRFRLSLPALDRHKRHLPTTLVEAQQAEVVLEATSLLARVEHLMQESEKIAAAAKLEKDWPAATSALREARSCLELLSRLRGETTEWHQGSGWGSGQCKRPAVWRQDGSAELDLAIAQHVAAATNNFDPEEIARLCALVECTTEQINASAGHGSPQVLDCEGQI